MVSNNKRVSNNKMEKIISRVVMLWVAMIFVTVGLLYDKMNEETKMFYHFGPSTTLFVFGLNIDTYPKYIIIVIYFFINGAVRTASKDILCAYLTNSVQDITKVKNKDIRCFAYEVTYVISIYGWIDWYIYLNLLLVQVDMLLIEITSDLIMSVLTTRYYLYHPNTNSTNSSPKTNSTNSTNSTNPLEIEQLAVIEFNQKKITNLHLHLQPLGSF